MFRHKCFCKMFIAMTALLALAAAAAAASLPSPPPVRISMDVVLASVEGANPAMLPSDVESVGIDAAIARVANDSRLAQPSAQSHLLFRAVLRLEYDVDRAPTPRTNVTEGIRRQLAAAADEQPHDPRVLAHLPLHVTASAYCVPRSQCTHGLALRIGGGCPCCDTIGGQRGVLHLSAIGKTTWLTPQLAPGSDAEREAAADPYSHPEREFPQCGAHWAAANEVELVMMIAPRTDLVRLAEEDSDTETAAAAAAAPKKRKK
jgi:hypothetical protein